MDAFEETLREAVVAYGPNLLAAGVILVVGYLLARLGVRLVRRGMTRAGVDETLYFDSCCHFNERGNEILAEVMAEAIVRSFDGAATSQAGTVVPTEITIYEDRSFDFILKTPPAPVDAP